MTTRDAVPTYTASQLGQQVREQRELQGLTQAELAARASVGRQWLNEFEGGIKEGARLDMVLRLLTALDHQIVLSGMPRAGGRP